VGDEEEEGVVAEDFFGEKKAFPTLLDLQKVLLILWLLKRLK
jgi:predicted RNA-binding protein